jgi:hypothetical protein
MVLNKTTWKSTELSEVPASCELERIFVAAKNKSR